MLAFIWAHPALTLVIAVLLIAVGLYLFNSFMQWMGKDQPDFDAVHPDRKKRWP